MGNEGRATAPVRPVEGMLMEATNARVVYLSGRVGLTVADRHQDAARVDAVAGSEFLDDRLDFV